LQALSVFDIGISGEGGLISSIPWGRPKSTYCPFAIAHWAFLFVSLCSNCVWQRCQTKMPGFAGQQFDLR